MDNKSLKGETFQNRYRITGKLKTLSPLHIGTGVEDDKRLPDHKPVKGDKKPSVAMVMKDTQGKPIIPGSALKGVLRHWLWSVLAGLGEEWAMTRNYEAKELVELSQEQQIEKVISEFSWLELLFGTPFHEGKIEVWDATCLTTSLPAPDKLLNWDSQALTYVDTSVAIEPETGTAVEHLLYKTEVVPPGVEFEFNLAGQNLSDTELGLVLLALQGFNSAIYPIRVGARGGRGYGRLLFTPGPIHCLVGKEGIQVWLKGALHSYEAASPDIAATGFEAGYYALPQLDTAGQKKLIEGVKAKLTALLSK
ncbi:MAG: RAMP superfamily CRISPR-associated protein [Chloroflexota bacterium]